MPTPTARSSKRIRFLPASTTRASARSTLYFKDIGRADYVSVTDTAALSAFRFVTQVEGIMPALESSHALAWVREYAPRAPRDEIVIVNLSGRGDKDIMTVAAIDEIAL